MITKMNNSARCMVRMLEIRGLARPPNWLGRNQANIARRIRDVWSELPEPLVERLSHVVATGGGTKPGDTPHNALGAVEHVLRQLKEAKIDANAVEPLAYSTDIRQLRRQAKELLLRIRYAAEAAEDAGS